MKRRLLTILLVILLIITITACNDISDISETENETEDITGCFSVFSLRLSPNEEFQFPTWISCSIPSKNVASSFKLLFIACSLALVLVILI